MIVQPSWAHVVKGGVSVVPSPPPLPPRPQPQVNARTITSEILKVAKFSLKHVEQVVKNAVGVGKVVNATVVPVSKPVGNELDEDDANYEHSCDLPASPAFQSMEVVDAFHDSEEEKRVDASRSAVQFKKAKLSDDISTPIPASSKSKNLASSPELAHKVPRSFSSNEQDNAGKMDDDGTHTNLFGLNYIMWFDLSIEGRTTEDEDWGGRINFGYSDNKFDKELEEYFLMFEDECSSQSCHSCVGRVMGVLFDKRDNIVSPPSYDPRSVPDLLDKYRDAHILDMGWREVDSEEWFADN